MLVEFDITKLKQLDGGRVFEALSQAIERAVADCDDRPGVLVARTVNFKIHIKPCVDEDGRMESINMSFGVSETRPQRKSQNYNLSARIRNGHVRNLFNDLSQDNVQQMTIDQVAQVD